MKRCADWKNCVAYDSKDEECQKTNGCFTKENIARFLSIGGRKR